MQTYKKKYNIASQKEYRENFIRETIINGVFHGENKDEIMKKLGIKGFAFGNWVRKFFGCYFKDLPYQFGLANGEDFLAQKIKSLLDMGIKTEKIAKTLGIKTRTVYLLKKQYNIQSESQKDLIKIKQQLFTYLKGKPSLAELSKKMNVNPKILINYIRRKYNCGLEELCKRAKEGNI